MKATATALPVRADNRLAALLDAAARRFAERGFAATTMRDIAGGAHMLPGSLYYHFPSKDHLLVAVYEAGVRELDEAVAAATAGVRDPWAALQAGCTAHLQALLRDSDYAQVLIRVLPSDVPLFADTLATLRERYEARWRGLVDALPLAPHTDRGALRLMLLGALNWSRFWFRPDGHHTPAQLARRFVGFLQEKPDA